jgi:hypothetical protein
MRTVLNHGYVPDQLRRFEVMSSNNPSPMRVELD